MRLATVLLSLVILLSSGCVDAALKGQNSLTDMSVSKLFPGDRQAQQLALAASEGDLEYIDKLLAQGADPNAAGRSGITVPCWVLYHPNKEGFRRLLEHGADPNIIWEGRKGYSDELSLIHVAAWQSPIIGTDYLEMIFEIGRGNPNLVVQNYRTQPLLWATRPSQADAFAVLYCYGADIHFKDGGGYTFLYRASLENYELAYFLLQDGADYEEITKHGIGIKNHIMSEARENRVEAVSGNKNAPQYYWFWRCVDFLEKRGMEFDIPASVEKFRPATLPTTPTDYEIEIEKWKKKHAN
ncbi:MULTISPECIES: ankyrin repeat domain-containing protein [unclassified Pseudodesulfovibrio]|uniref:ankyrin repeat domain-containing protein n=1 Tax=unclassified Pseudodesulfovibrio TaxID=2661612 RepID=UPI000FEBE015|nr:MULTISPECIES: ankyrin repeat domain-containing protein [unclassified Pseudodesulfovibrio]MCJ2166324.1 ankyrin repeat domain-containing protein [Pseudodesulfovibrio sp. S3-i]RWU02223.1 ankyrin repeat domain-containing protein [Pseudodesulfovibrio sp. S3]